jgi:hypothetical protein
MIPSFQLTKSHLRKHLNNLDYDANKYIGRKEIEDNVKAAKANGRIEEKWRPIIFNYSYVDHRWFSIGNQTSVLAEFVKRIFSLLGSRFSQKAQPKKELTEKEKKQEEEEATTRLANRATVGGAALLVGTAFMIGHLSSIFQNQKKTLAFSQTVYNSLRELRSQKLKDALSPIIEAEYAIDTLRVKQVTDYLYAAAAVAIGSATLVGTGLMKNEVGIKFGILITIAGLCAAAFAYTFHRNDEAKIEQHYQVILDPTAGADHVLYRVLPKYNEDLTVEEPAAAYFSPAPLFEASAPAWDA